MTPWESSLGNSMYKIILRAWLLAGLITIILIGGQIMTNQKLTPEARQFMQQMKTTKKTGTPWRKAFREYVITHPVTTVDEIIKATRPDLVKPLQQDRKRVLKNVSSILNQLRKELVDIEMDHGVIRLIEYFDFSKNQAVKPKTKAKRRTTTK